MHDIDRIHAMDNLRALAMLAGVVFHAALAFSPLMHPLWPAADAENSIAVDAIAWFLHQFRMPLFFTVAGYFAALLVARRGMAGLFRNRCARILLPLLVFAAPLLAGMSGLTGHAATTVAHPSPALAWIRAHIDQHGGMPSSPGWAHLWFLFYLLQFTVLVWVASALGLWRIGQRLATLPAPALVVGLPVLLTPPLALVGTPWPAPDFLVPSLWALVFFGLYFTLGYQLFLHGGLLERLRPFSPFLLAAAVIAHAILFVATEGFIAVPPTTMRNGVNALLEACAGSWMTLWCLLAARRWLNTRSAAMRWLADSSYWVYLIHLPMLLAIQYRLLDMPMHWTAKFIASVALTFLFSFASYQWLVRHTVI
ncbi:MAG: acyltransferase family protein, partial [Dokdonella sp.]|nr:acyltransferase family protein [Dokdonella sp.]